MRKKDLRFFRKGLLVLLVASFSSASFAAGLLPGCLRPLYEAIVPSRFSRWVKQSCPARTLVPTNARLPILVIGTGPAGLATMDALKRRGISFVGVDSAAGFGGMWLQSNPNSAAYNHLVTNSSKATTHLGMEHEPGTPDFLTHAQALAYLQRFAETRLVGSSVVFNTKVESAKYDPVANYWNVRFGSGSSSQYRAVIVATGHNTPANAVIPKRLLDQAQAAQIPYLHSSRYRDPADFVDGATLIVGFGNSGAEIATAISEQNPETYISIRSPRWLVPDYVGRTPADEFANSGFPLPHWLEMLGFHLIQRVTVGHPSRIGIGTPDHGLLDRLPVADRGIAQAIRDERVHLRSDIKEITPDGKVIFVDSSQPALSPSRIIFATGYRREYPFLAGQYGNLEDPNFYLSFSVFHPDHRGLSFLPELVVPQGAWPLFVEQANAIAAYYAAEALGGGHVELFDSLRGMPNPDFKGHIFSRADQWHVDPKRVTELLRAYSEWIGRP
ncbi:MAG: NAD(P)/FAD-dependent oxidoreductase [Bdellovibrionaceae bacterium]|nr:NAD(P)/FAD-dependent oxidoreductase [Bdellovibrionales bacterium]MCB9253305.1 NAD(P)/FAD-dependent oxidoreductase [Pseudobdellovibrionaceae bacterium]